MKQVQIEGETTMAYASIELQNQTIRIQTVPGSGVIGVYLPNTEPCYYDSGTGRFNTTPMLGVADAHLAFDQLEELKEKLNDFNARRRAAIARLNQAMAMNSSTP
jgi:hypothetical protein